MMLTLEYPDKYRLWSDLIRGNSDRVFVPTEVPPPLGSRISVKLSLPGLPLAIAIEGTIIGRRLRSGRFAAGAYIRIADDQIEKCRRFLGLNHAPERYVQGRKAVRVPCELPITFVEPKVSEPGLAKNLSETGVLAAAPVEVAVGQRVQGTLALPGDEVLPFVAEVSWARNDKKLAGLRFLELPQEDVERVQRAIERLSRAAHGAEDRKPIVIADDEPNMLGFLEKALAKHGYEVRIAQRGEEALDLIRELKPALVILDILMPGIDGVDICKMMRADVEMMDIPVIFLSALETERLNYVADESGATDYLCKPVNLADLLNLVGTYLKS